MLWQLILEFNKDGMSSPRCEKKRKYTLKWWITLTESCSNFFWHISLNSDLVRPVFASHPAMAFPICRAYSSQPCLLSCFLSSASEECGRREVSMPGRFDVFLRKKSAFHKHPVFSRQTDQARHRRVWHFNAGVPTGRLSWWGATHDTLWYLTSILRANTRPCVHTF